MMEREKLIRELDEADLFLRNLINAEPAPLNNYDKDILLKVARAADKAARMLEKVGDAHGGE